jgi:hypothetical protein
VLRTPLGMLLSVTVIPPWVLVVVTLYTVAAGAVTVGR